MPVHAHAHMAAVAVNEGEESTPTENEVLPLGGDARVGQRAVGRHTPRGVAGVLLPGAPIAQ